MKAIAYKLSVLVAMVVMFVFSIYQAASGQYFQRAASFVRYWFACATLSLRFDVDDIEKEIKQANRELQDQVRRRSMLNRLPSQDLW